jgi:hypothetical protein
MAMAMEMEAVTDPFADRIFESPDVQRKAFVVAPRNTGRMFKCEDTNVVASTGPAPRRS